MKDIDTTVKNALMQFTEEVFTRSWWGKEREAVSLFAFGYLTKQCSPDCVLFDPAQIGIEVRVPQVERIGMKREVCKDLVIWSGPGATCWDKDQYPLAILEWKANQAHVAANDVAWLTTFSAGRPGFVGYAICLDLKKRTFRLSCTRIQSEKVRPEWLVL
ncbi:MAG: hypothetical protein JXB85_11780 [Anaerolineales bacterium]|nr:hypothetical protein [Anaerolineales bacterium]